MKICEKHPNSEFYIATDGYQRCKKCRSESVARQRKRNKQILVDEHGGKCIICGYSKSLRALEFHHRDPSTKLFSVSANTRIISLDKMREEAKKCDLVCANCHAEIEDLKITSSLG